MNPSFLLWNRICHFILSFIKSFSFVIQTVAGILVDFQPKWEMSPIFSWHPVTASIWVVWVTTHHHRTSSSRVLYYFHIWSYRPSVFPLVNVTGLAGILANQSGLFDNCRLGPDRQSRQGRAALHQRESEELGVVCLSQDAWQHLLLTYPQNK